MTTAKTTGPIKAGTGKPAPRKAPTTAVDTVFVEPAPLPSGTSVVPTITVTHNTTAPVVPPTFAEKVMAVLTKPLLADEIKERDGGRGGKLKYISGDFALRRLIEATGGNYDTEIVGHEFVDIEQSGKTKRAMLAHVRVTIPYLGSKEAFGIQILQGGEDMYKGAVTDGIKKALTQWGLALDLYDDDFVPEERVEEPTVRQKLVALLKDRGIKTKAAATEAVVARYPEATDMAALTEAQMTAWVKELEANPVAPF